MLCPRCQGSLEIEQVQGVEVDRCRSCRGLWLDYPELDQLEDTVLAEDEVKGTMAWRLRPGDLACPRCQKPMQVFNYRAYNLELDFCPQEHGFWLDAGEERRVLELMRQRIQDLGRASQAEVQWASLLQRFKSRAFADRFRRLRRR